MAKYKIIKLTRGVVAAVDAKDFERVNKHLWTPNVQAGKVKNIQTYISDKQTALHRFILGLKPGDKRQVDHWNGNVYDNRRCNLRICSNAENGMNRKKLAGATSRYKGVSPVTGGKRHPFQAQIWIDGHPKYLGCFAIEVEAAKAYDTAARQYFGRFARLNFPRKPELPPVPPPEVVDQELQPTTVHTGQRDRKASNFIGVSTAGKKWRWMLGYKGKRYTKAGFPTQLQAARAREDFITKKGWPHVLNFDSKGE